MTVPGATPKVLILVSDLPGHFLDVASGIAKVLLQNGVEPLFAVTSPYYERFRGTAFGEIGTVRYLSDFLEGWSSSGSSEPSFLDRWLAYPTFVRQSYYYGSHMNAWSSYEGVACFFRELFEHEPCISLVWSEPPSNSFLYVAHAEARRRNLPYFGYMPARIAEHFNVFLDEYGERLLRNEGSTGDPLAAPGEPDYMANPQNRLAQYSLRQLVSGAIDKLQRALQAADAPSIETGITPWYQIRAYRKLLGRRWRHWSISRFERPFVDTPSWSEKNLDVLFPLQLRPEASTSVLARHFADDAEIIRNVAFSLPAHARLFVKEHRAAVGIRGRSFYREIRHFPGVQLLGPEFPLADHLERFDAVVTLTSTVGFEALQLGVPVYVLGRVFYDRYPGATRTDSFERLCEGLRSLRKRSGRGAGTGVRETYQRFCFPGTFNYMSPSVAAPDNVARLSRPILDHLRQRAG